MSDYEFISEEIFDQVSDDQSWGQDKEDEIKSQEDGEKVETQDRDVRALLIQKKIKLLNKRVVLARIPVKKFNPSSALFLEKINFIKEAKPKTFDCFYKTRADPGLVSKLELNNCFYKIRRDADPKDLKQENESLSQQVKEIKNKKFIEAQYYRLLSKNN